MLISLSLYLVYKERVADVGLGMLDIAVRISGMLSIFDSNEFHFNSLLYNPGAYIYVSFEYVVESRFLTRTLTWKGCHCIIFYMDH